MKTIRRFYICLSLSMLLFISLGCGNSSNNAATEAKILSLGSTVKITKECFAASSKSGFDKLVGLTGTTNTQSAQNMLLSGQLFILKTEDYGEIEQIDTGWVKIKILNGFLKGKELFTFREMVTKVDSKEAYDADKNLAMQQKRARDALLAYSNFSSFDISAVKPEEISLKNKQIYKNWEQSIARIAKEYPSIDKAILKIFDDFINQKRKISKAEVMRIWEQADDIREQLIDIKSPQGISPAVDDHLWRMASDYRNGINDRQAGLWRIIEYLDQKNTFSDTVESVNSCLKTSSEFFKYYGHRKNEFNRIFP